MAAVLEREIVQAKWAPGTKLPGEEELCARFGASRPAVREALQALKTRGLVESRRGSGSYVTSERGAAGVRDMLALYSLLRRDAPSFIELLDLRLLVETFCLRRLATSASGQGLDRLRKCLTRMEDSVDDLARFGREDISFHLTLVEEAGHELFSHIMRGLLPSLGTRFALETYNDAKLIGRNLADHRAIFRLIKSGEADAAEDRLKKHLTNSRRHLESMLQDLAGRSTAEEIAATKGHADAADQ
jgi:DNA-binding FadR family transcriptional regulator